MKPLLKSLIVLAVSAYSTAFAERYDRGADQANSTRSELRYEQEQTAILEQKLGQMRLRAEIQRQEAMAVRSRLSNEQEEQRLRQTEANNTIYRANYIGTTILNLIRQSSQLRR